MKVDGDKVLSVKGDKDDVFSHGFICPKATGLKSLQEDPDRLTQPMLKQPDGTLAPVSWDEAFAVIDQRLMPLLDERGRDACAVYLGNPSAHSLSTLLAGRVWIKALGSKNIYSASTVDQMPKQVSAGLMFGTMLSVPIPDVDRTDHLLILGANPLASNGSLMTAPDMRGRLRAIRERGGKIVVVDPRRTRTAEAADEHHFIRPGTDAHLLFAMVHTLFDEGLVGAAADRRAPGRARRDRAAGAAVHARRSRAPVTGVPPRTIRRLARELAAAERGVVYGRIGTCTQEFGTLASWLVDVLNVLTGNLDEPGGAMFPRGRGQASTRGKRAAAAASRWAAGTAACAGCPEAFGELPVACLAEEIDTPGEGQVRALITVAGNPALSTPNAERLERGARRLDFMVSLDIYVNETTRHADVILPAPPPLQKSQYDLAFYQLSVRNVANYSPVVIENGTPAEWETLLRLTGVALRPGAERGRRRDRGLRRPDRGLRRGRQPALAAVRCRRPRADGRARRRRGAERLLDLVLRAGPYDLTLDDLERAARHRPGPARAAHPGGAAHAERQDRARARADRRRRGPAARGAGRARERRAGAGRPPPAALEQLVDAQPAEPGRRHQPLHAARRPADAERIGLVDGGSARVRSRAGEVVADVEVTDAVMEGVVSLPHGWGHGKAGARDGGRGGDHAGVNSNVLSDELEVDPLSGNAVLNGIPVEVEPAGTPRARGRRPPSRGKS